MSDQSRAMSQALEPGHDPYNHDPTQSECLFSTFEASLLARAAARLAKSSDFYRGRLPELPNAYMDARFLDVQ